MYEDTNGENNRIKAERQKTFGEVKDFANDADIFLEIVFKELELERERKKELESRALGILTVIGAILAFIINPSNKLIKEAFIIVNDGIVCISTGTCIFILFSVVVVEIIITIICAYKVLCLKEYSHPILQELLDEYKKTMYKWEYCLYSASKYKHCIEESRVVNDDKAKWLKYALNMFCLSIATLGMWYLIWQCFMWK